MNKWTIANGNQTAVLVNDDSNQMGIIVFADDLEQAQTNARLIAAAPDLLDACKHVIKEAKNVKGKMFSILPVLNAITKAESQQADEPERTG